VQLDLVCGAAEIAMLVVMIISSGLIFVPINLFVVTLSFWMIDSLPIVRAVFNMRGFAGYPADNLSQGHPYVPDMDRFIWITAFYPTAYFIDKSEYIVFALWTPVATFLCCCLLYLSFMPAWILADPVHLISQSYVFYF
jgi:ABC-2 type transport system permease protein